MNQQAQGQGQNGNGQPNGNNGHPAWQEYLKDVPDALRPVVEDAFKKWDANVTQRFQEIHNQYAPLKQYEALAQNQIPIQRIGEALQFANEVERDPKAMALKMNQTFNLGLVEQQAAQQAQQFQQTDPYGESPYGEITSQVDIMQHPMVQQMSQTLQALQQRFSEQDEQAQIDAEASQFEQYVTQLFAGKPHLENNMDAKMVFTSFVENGLDANAALQKVDSIYTGNIQQQLEQQVNQTTQTVEQPGNTDSNVQAWIDSLQGGGQQNQQVPDQNNGTGEAPVVLGGAGTVGSGSPTAPLDFGSFGSKDINALVADVLAKDNG